MSDETPIKPFDRDVVVNTGPQEGFVPTKFAHVPDTPLVLATVLQTQPPIAPGTPAVDGGLTVVMRHVGFSAGIVHWVSPGTPNGQLRIPAGSQPTLGSLMVNLSPEAVDQLDRVISEWRALNDLAGSDA